MGHVPRGTVAVDHLQRLIAGIRELVKDPGRNEDRLPRGNRLTFVAETHLAGPLDDEVDLLLLLIVPWHLPALRLERDMAHREILRLDRRRAADQILRVPARRITPPGDLREIRDNHGPKNVRYGFAS